MNLFKRKYFAQKILIFKWKRIKNIPAYTTEDILFSCISSVDFKIFHFLLLILKNALFSHQVFEIMLLQLSQLLRLLESKNLVFSDAIGLQRVYFQHNSKSNYKRKTQFGILNWHPDAICNLLQREDTAYRVTQNISNTFRSTGKCLIDEIINKWILTIFPIYISILLLPEVINNL